MAKNEKYEKAEFTSCLKKHENMDTQKVLPAGGEVLAQQQHYLWLRPELVLLWLLAPPHRWMRLPTASAKRGGNRAQFDRETIS